MPERKKRKRDHANTGRGERGRHYMYQFGQYVVCAEGRKWREREREAERKGRAGEIEWPPRKEEEEGLFGRLVDSRAFVLLWGGRESGKRGNQQE